MANNRDGVGALGVTPRAFLVGALGAFVIGIAVPYSDMLIKGSRMATWSTAPAAYFLFFLMVGIVNVLLRLIHRNAALRPGELAVVFIMMLIPTTVVSRGLVGFLLPVMSGAFYFATPENNWVDLIHPYIPEWMVPQGAQEIRYFFEGLPRGDSIPWDVWIKPLGYWILFILSLYFVLICMMVILRKQWSERERLLYPIVQVPMEMAQDDAKRSWIKPFFKNPVMWIGFLIPVVITSVNALHNYYGFLPQIDIYYQRVYVYRRDISFMFHTSFPMIGFGYLIPLDVAFGLWFFHIVVMLQQGILNVLGMGTRQDILGPHTQYADPSIVHQSIGASIVLVLLGLWIARSHLRDVFRKAFRGAEDVDDSEEILSYRAAVFGMIGGLLFMGIWLNRSGLPGWIVPIFLFGAFVTFITLTRVIAEGGVAAMFPCFTALGFTASTVGTPVLGPTGIAALGFTYIWEADILIFLMPACAHSLKLGETIPGRRRALFWAIMLSIVIGLFTAIPFVIKAAYTSGGINLDRFYFTWAPQNYFGWMAQAIATPQGPSVQGWVHTGIGALVMVLLMQVRYRLLWWPLHPLGYTVSAHFYYTWFSVFVAWLLKSIVLKYGGPKLYRQTRPFFLGLILGQFVIAGLWVVIDYFTGMTGNRPYSL